MRPAGWTLRMATLLGVGTFVVHQLRFALAGEPEPAAGHGYLVPLGPVLAGLLLLAFASAIARLARGAADPAPRLRRLWAGSSAGLFAVYCAQEAIEGLLTTGHPGGLGHGGWLALPLAIAIGLAIALLVRGTAAALPAPVRPRLSVAPILALPGTPTLAGARACTHRPAARGPPVLSV